MQTEGDRIKHLRKDLLQLTLDKFGEGIGVRKSILSLIENGKSNVTDQMRKSICNAYNVSEKWLISGDGDIFLEQDRRAQLMAWADRVLKDSDSSFRWRFVSLLMSLPEEWWDVLEEKAKEIFCEENGREAGGSTTYEVKNNFGAVGTGATVINNEKTE